MYHHKITVAAFNEFYSYDEILSLINLFPCEFAAVNFGMFGENFAPILDISHTAMVYQSDVRLVNRSYRTL